MRLKLVPIISALGAVLLLSGMAFPKSAWRWVDSGTPYFLNSISAPDSLHIWVTGGILLHSTDGGKTWFNQFDPGQYSGLHIVTFVDTLHG